MEGIYIAIILLCRVVQAIFSKRASNNIDGVRALTRYIAFSNTFSALLGLVLIFAQHGSFRVDALTVVIAAF